MVEDEYLIAMEVKRWLAAAGAEVVGPVPSVDQALDLIDRDGLDAALLDVNLGDGYTVYALVARGIPYVLATGNTRASIAGGFREQPLLEKPYLETDVTPALAALLG